MSKIYYTWEQFDVQVEQLADQIKNADCDFTGIYGIPKGGIPVAVALSRLLSLPLVVETEIDECTLIVDDLVDSGNTISRFAGTNHVATLQIKSHSPVPDFWVEKVDGWIVYPWEGSEEKSIEDNIVRIIQFIGEDPTRPGLLETPARVARSFKELYAGYHQKPEDVFKVFDEEGYNELVWMKNIEFYSTCEHHMLIFFGKAHVAYIANSNRVVGASKLARLVDIFARRMTTQERIAKQVTEALMQHLKPVGAACIIEGVHMCMRCRGVSKQTSEMGTSCLRGRFLEDTDAGRAARAELMTLLK